MENRRFTKPERLISLPPESSIADATDPSALNAATLAVAKRGTATTIAAVVLTRRHRCESLGSW